MGFKDECIKLFQLQEQVHIQERRKKELLEIETTRKLIVKQINEIEFHDGLTKRNFNLNVEDIKLIETANLNYYFLFSLEDLLIRCDLSPYDLRYSIAHKCKECEKGVFLYKIRKDKLNMQEIGKLIVNFENATEPANLCQECRNEYYEAQREKHKPIEERDKTLSERFAKLIIDLLDEYQS